MEEVSVIILVCVAAVYMIINVWITLMWIAGEKASPVEVIVLLIAGVPITIGVFLIIVIEAIITLIRRAIKKQRVAKEIKARNITAKEELGSRNDMDTTELDGIFEVPDSNAWQWPEDGSHM